ncbi:hypothetical protein [Leekyejoonella antrihumi]|uniref:Uncharacterized protein n=1 Tax=Leekyejoonella antrihumi TaxID=1660198 RepID=A0A563E831_9MICO|nr:hypothetical protein [Leekyejoonella antrihumi]TWP37984.1 hypothetical protein FGL98_04555 [Leekyejoonella antrihumi]
MTDPHEVTAVLCAMTLERNRLLLGATRHARALGAVVVVKRDRFVLTSTLLEPTPPAPVLATARGDVADLGLEACTIVDDIADYLAVPPQPLAPGRAESLTAEDALMLAEQLRRGDPTHIDEALGLIGLSHPPTWLVHLAPGCQARLSATLLDRVGFEVFADITVTPDGWGELVSSEDETLTFDPMTLEDVQARICQACDVLATRSGASRRVA